MTIPLSFRRAFQDREVPGSRASRACGAVLPSLLLAAAASLAACADTSQIDQICDPGSYTCRGTVALRCFEDGTGYQVDDDCAASDLTCVEPYGCRVCVPNQQACFGEKLLRCNDSGSGFLATPLKVCDAAAGEICYQGGCENACALARKNRSYVGCEYWAVDLDNAVVQIGAAAAQQFAVALSNPSALPAAVRVTIDEAAVGEPAKIKVVEETTVRPQALEVLLLSPLEVDGSPPGEFNTGTGTAITKSTYRIESTVPLIAYQFNPLSNVGVFSNDASLLIPVAALTADSENKTGAPYVVMGWPQTIASTDDPRTNFGDDLRAFLTMVATRDDTKVRVGLSTSIISDGDGGAVPALMRGDVLELTLDAHEVLNLETGGFGPDADFTGTTVETDKPLVVYSGSEASDVPDPPDLTVRRCCADHIEQQLYPITTLGRTFIALTTPSRSEALSQAGAKIQPAVEKEYFRILATSEFTAVTTNLPAPDNALNIGGRQFVSLEVDRDFTVEATDPVVVGQFVAGQQQAGIPQTLPGGDPSFILLPPVEQFRKDYLFLTPDKYSYDFILIAAPDDALVRLDGRVLPDGCDASLGQKLCCTKGEVGKVKLAGDQVNTEFVSYKCQLSFPNVIEGKTPPNNLQPGSQNDGVHRLSSTRPVGLVVYGFDAYVSYGYPGGTDLALINIK